MNRTRRNVIVGAGITAAAAAAIGYEGWWHFGKHYPPTPYDDLLGLLPDREAAKQVGRVFLAANNGFESARAATALRHHLSGISLGHVLNDEIAQGELIEAGHWLLPQTLVGLCALAAKT